MLPSEFISQYGRAVLSRVSLDLAGSARIAADPHRIVLTFWGCLGPVDIMPGGEGSEVFDRFRFNTNDRPVSITHALHGPIVNLSWRVFSTGAGQFITYIETFQKPTKSNRRTDQRPERRTRA